eukprot:768209-Amphidinium_carterae.1
MRAQTLCLHFLSTRKFRGIPVSLGKSQAAEIDDPVLNKEDALIASYKTTQSPLSGCFNRLGLHAATFRLVFFSGCVPCQDWPAAGGRRSFRFKVVTIVE